MNPYNTLDERKRQTDVLDMPSPFDAVSRPFYTLVNQIDDAILEHKLNVLAKQEPVHQPLGWTLIES